MRIARDSGDSSTSAIQVLQDIESANSYPFAGKTITFSFYAKAGANYSAASSSLSYILVSGTGTDQRIANGYTGSVTLTNTAITLTTSWQRFTATVTVGSSATQLGFYFAFTPTGTAGANDWFEITGIQIEVGSVATPFRRAGGTLAGELAACQRYYEKSFNVATAPTTATSQGYVTGKVASNTVANNERYGYTFFKVSKRSQPTITIRPYTTPTNTGRVSNTSGTDLGANSGVAISNEENGFGVYNNSGGTLTTDNLAVIWHWEANSEL